MYCITSIKYRVIYGDRWIIYIICIIGIICIINIHIIIGIIHIIVIIGIVYTHHQSKLSYRYKPQYLIIINKN